MFYPHSGKGIVTEPYLYLVNVMRYSFLGISDIEVGTSLMVLAVLWSTVVDLLSYDQKGGIKTEHVPQI